MRRPGKVCACVSLWVLAVGLACAGTGGEAAAGQTHHVPGGGNLQAALNAAAPGATITLDPGAIYTGTVTLPAKPCTPVSTITTANVRLTQGQRVDPGWRGRLAILQSGSTQPAIRTAAGTCGWALRGLEFRANRTGQSHILEFGHGWNVKRVDDLPRDIFLSHLLVDVEGPQRRGVMLNAINGVVENSHLAGFWRAGQDSQAIGAYNTPGPITIRNNYLTAGSEVIIFGGADPGITNVVPSDILIEGNHLTRPVEWRGDRTKVVKNLFELKVGRRVVVRGNLMEHNWPAAQTGWAVLLKSENQDGRCTACVTENVLFERNIVRHTASGVNIVGWGSRHPTERPTNRITIRDNLFVISRAGWGGQGWFLQMGGAPRNVTVEHNTVVHDGNNLVAADEGTRMRMDRSKAPGGPIEGFVYRRNLSLHGRYGFFTAGGGNSGCGMGVVYLNPIVTENVMAGGRGSCYAAGNLFPRPEEFKAQFVDFDGGDYRLAPSSQLRSATRDGRDLGANIEALESVQPRRTFDWPEVEEMHRRPIPP